MSYRCHKRRPTSIGADHIFRSQMNTYIAADGQVLQSSMVKDGSPSKRQITGSTSQVRFSLPVDHSDTEDEYSKDNEASFSDVNFSEDEWVDVTDDGDETNIAKDEPVQRSANHYDHRRFCSEDIRGRSHSRTSSVADSMRELLSTSPERHRLFLKPHSDLNNRKVAVPVELSLPPSLSPRNKSIPRPTSLVFNGSNYEPFEIAFLDKSRTFSVTPKRLFESSVITGVPNQQQSKTQYVHYNGKISITDLIAEGLSTPQLNDNPKPDIETEVKNPSPAAKRQNNRLNRSFCFPSKPGPSCEQKDLPDIPSQQPLGDVAHSLSGLSLYTPEGPLESPNRSSYRFAAHKLEVQSHSPIKFHQRRTLATTNNAAASPEAQETAGDDGLKRSHRVSSSKYSNVPSIIPSISSSTSGRSFGEYRGISANGIDYTTTRNINNSQRVVSEQSVVSHESVQISLQDSIQGSLQDSIQCSTQASIQESLVESTQESHCSTEEKSEDLTAQLAQLGVSILAGVSLSDGRQKISKLSHKHEVSKKISEGPGIGQKREPTIKATQNETFEGAPITRPSATLTSSYHDQQPHRVFAQDTVEDDNIRSTSQRYTKSLLRKPTSPLLSQSSYETAVSEQFSHASTLTSVNSDVNDICEVIDLTQEPGAPLISAEKASNTKEYKTIIRRLSNGDFRETIFIDDEEGENFSALRNADIPRRSAGVRRRPMSYHGGFNNRGSHRDISGFSFETVASEVQMNHHMTDTSQSTLLRHRNYQNRTVIDLCDDTLKDTRQVIEDLQRQKTILLQRRHDLLRQKKEEEKRLFEVRSLKRALSTKKTSNDNPYFDYANSQGYDFTTFMNGGNQVSPS